MSDVRYPYPQWRYPYPWLVFCSPYIPGPVRCTYCRTSMHPRRGLQPWAPEIGRHPASLISRHVHATICHPPSRRPPPPSTTPAPAPAPAISSSISLLPAIVFRVPAPTREPVDIPVHLDTLYDPNVRVPLYIGRESDGWLVHSFHWDFADFNDFDDPSDEIIEGRWRVWDPDFVHPGLLPQPRSQPSSATEAGWRLAHSHGSHHWVQEQPLVYRFPPRDADANAVERGGSQPYRFPPLASDPLDRSGADDIPQPRRVDYTVNPFSRPRPPPNPGSHGSRSRERRAAGTAALGIGQPTSSRPWRLARETSRHSAGQTATGDAGESSHTVGQATSSRPPLRRAAPDPPPPAASNSNASLPTIGPAATRSTVLSPLAAPFRPASSRPASVARSAKQTSAVSAVTETSGQSGSVVESSMTIGGSQAERRDLGPAHGPPASQARSEAEAAPRQSCSSLRFRATVDQHFDNSSLWKRGDHSRRGTRFQPERTHLTQASLSALADEMAMVDPAPRILTRSVSEPLRLGSGSDDRPSTAAPPRPPVHTPREHQSSSAGQTALSLWTEIAFASKPEPTGEESASTGRGRRAVSSPAGFPRFTGLCLGNGFL